MRIINSINFFKYGKRKAERETKLELKSPVLPIVIYFMEVSCFLWLYKKEGLSWVLLFSWQELFLNLFLHLVGEGIYVEGQPTENVALIVSVKSF